MLTLTYYGHSCFLLDDGQYKVLFDPFLTGNPKAAIAAADVDCDYILVSHAHSDHLGDAPEIAARTGAAIVAIPEVGETYHGKIRSIVAFGAFVEIMPGKDALLHISEIDYKRFETMEETGLKEGDEIDVKLIGIDPKTGKLKLSRKALLPKPEGYVERERRPRPERGERRERREHKGE